MAEEDSAASGQEPSQKLEAMAGPSLLRWINGKTIAVLAERFPWLERGQLERLSNLVKQMAATMVCVLDEKQRPHHLKLSTDVGVEEAIIADLVGWLAEKVAFHLHHNEETA